MEVSAKLHVMNTLPPGRKETEPTECEFVWAPEPV